MYKTEFMRKFAQHAELDQDMDREAHCSLIMQF